MREAWKRDIVRAFVIVVVVAIVAVIINWLRTPIFNSAAEAGLISRARARQLHGVNLIDSWQHRGWPEVAQTPPDPVTEPPAEEVGQTQAIPIGLLKAKELYDSGGCVFFDAREPEYYEEGHIAGALNWPSDQFDLYYGRHADTAGRDECIIVYCIGGACDESYHLAISLVMEGYREVYLYEGGLEEWQLVGYEVRTGPEP